MSDVSPINLCQDFATSTHGVVLHDPTDEERELALLDCLLCSSESPGQLIVLPLRPDKGESSSFTQQTCGVTSHCRRAFALEESSRSDGSLGYDAQRWCDCADLSAREQVERTRYLANQLNDQWDSEIS
jgi:hypothetical protein